MKKLMTAIVALLLPFCVTDAQGLFSKKEYDGGRQPRETYMQGAVPEEDGKVVFRQSFEAPGLSKSDIFQKLSAWASFRYNPTTEYGKWTDANYFKNTEYARVLKASAEEGVIKIQGNEELVFTNKTLAKDTSVTGYTLLLEIQDGKASAEIRNINYTYSLTENPERIDAEDWITDSEAITKQNKLNRGSGKFRVKTIDLKDELFSEIANTLAQ